MFIEASLIQASVSWPHCLNWPFCLVLIQGYPHVGMNLYILTTSLIWPTSLGPKVAGLRRFHCTLCTMLVPDKWDIATSK